MSASRREQKHTTGRTIAMIGGGAFLAWLLLRGKGWGFGGSGSGSPASAAVGPDSPVPPTPPPPPPACRVHIGADGVDLDGTRADLAATVSRCRASGAADVTVSGAAIVRSIAEAVQALQAAGVQVRAEAAVWDTVHTVSTRRP